MNKIQKKTENRFWYCAVAKALMFTLLFTGLTGCKSKEAQFLIDGFQEAQAQVEAEKEMEKSGKQISEDENDKANEKNQADNTGQGNESLNSESPDSESSGADAETSSENEEKSDGENDNTDNVRDLQNERNSEVFIQKKIFVDVCGAVVNPGVFQLEEGSRVFQAIEAAGGYLPEAAQTCVNRAGVLRDGQQLYILTQEEMEQQGMNPAELAKAAESQQPGNAGTDGMSGTEEILPGQQEFGQSDSEVQDSRININTADEALLTTLTGIGATRAQAIIAYREENGPFAAIEEIMNVQGIKEGTFAKIKDKIVVE